ncbi:MAG TPA: hypothetical protein VMN39_10590 [Longimicrobiaceae bacterium]|nr:hypothetical protein [Longimicrobiaceae bacterium]
MRLRSLAIVLTFGLLSGAAVTPAHGQVPATVAVSDTVWTVQLADGSTLYGRVVEAGEDRLTLVSEGGVRVELARAQIRSMAPIRGTIRDGVVWPADPNTTRLFFGPTGRMMPAGEGYVAAFELFLPFVSYSLTDWFTIAGGTPLVPEIIGEIVYVAPKVGIYQRPDLAVSAGVLAFFSRWDDFESAGILFGVGTWGESDRSLTFGTGWPFARGDLASRPVFMGGGETRLTRRTKLVSENYLITYEETVGPGGQTRTQAGGMVSGGIRFIGDRLSADLGLGLGFDGSDTACCMPLVNFVYHFGGAR